MWINKSKRYLLPTLCQVLIYVTLVFPLTDLFGNIMCPVLQMTELRLCTHVICQTPTAKYTTGNEEREFHQCRVSKASWRWWHLIWLLKDGKKGGSCSRKAVLIMRAKCGAPLSVMGPADRVEFRLQKKELFLMQNVSLSGVCQDQVEKLGSWLQLCAGRRQWAHLHSCWC